ncbi:MAG: DNA-binding protein [Azoarcus sp.]|jgi:gp16 family phage-associated protein|nr:DNA-binding protein [Azoarcus sp.]
MDNGKVLTPREARELFRRLGIVQAEWARRHGVSSVLTSEILRGRRKCLRGQSHKIAVLLGIKPSDGIFFPTIALNCEGDAK